MYYSIQGISLLSVPQFFLSLLDRCRRRRRYSIPLDGTELDWVSYSPLVEVENRYDPVSQISVQSVQLPISEHYLTGKITKDGN